MLSAAIGAEYTWGVSVIVLITVCSWVAYYCGHVIWNANPPGNVRPLLGVAIVLSVAVGVYLVWIQDDFSNCISRALLTPTLGSIDSGIRDRPALTVVVDTLHWSQLFGVTTVIFAALAVFSLLHIASPESVPTGQNVASAEPAPAWQSLERRVSRLRIVLYSSAIALVAFYVQQDALFAIPEALIPPTVDDMPNGELEVLRNLANGLKVFWGSGLTLVLVALFVPASIVLRRRSVTLAKNENPGALPVQLEAWMKDHGLMESWPTQLAKVAAMLAPLLAGPLATLGAKLTDIAP